MDTTILDTLPELSTPKILSETIGIPLGTLAFWRHAGRGPRFLKLGGRVIRHRKQDVSEWLSESVQETTGGAA